MQRTQHFEGPTTVASAPAAQRSRRIRATMGVGAMVLGAALSAVPTGHASAAVGDNIVVTKTSSVVGGPCLPAALTATYVARSTADAFTLVVTLGATPCEPVEATAAIYAMPGNGVAWPQQLVETESLRFDEAGVTEIRFNKTCIPAQFDVVTGATPQTISPLGAVHGPLLFPGDIGTAQQYWGRADCTPVPPTTSAPATSAPVTSAPVTSAPVTSAPVVDSASVTAPPRVLGVSSTVAPSPKAVVASSVADPSTPSSLAVTGASSTAMVGLALGLVAVGAALLFSTRSRPRASLPSVAGMRATPFSLESGQWDD